MTNNHPQFNYSSIRFVIIGVLIFRFLLRSSHSFQLLGSRRYDRFTVTTRESIAFPIHHQPCEISTFAFHPIGKLNSCSKTRLYFDDRSADMMEALVGGMRYEMVELPDSLVDTTVFVGNLCEFVSDEDLSSLFQQVSTLNFLPACVARKPNSSSLCYGFVTFPTVQEKESAIIRFSGHVLNDKAIRVEPIIDYKFRVRVPEKLVSYSLGPAKQLRGGGRNTLRQVSEQSSREGPLNQKCSHDKSWRKKKYNRAGRDSRMKTHKTHAPLSSARDKDREKRVRRKQQRHRDQFDMGELV